MEGDGPSSPLRVQMEEDAGLSSPPRGLRVRPERFLKKEIPKKVEEKVKNLQLKWSSNEMKLAMEGLNEHGLTRIQAISKPLFFKSPQQVKGWLWKMGTDAYKTRRPLGIDKILQEEKCALGVSIALRDRCKPARKAYQHFSAITKSILLIENFEHHPLQSDDQIDFKQLYYVLYMGMKGYPLPKMNKATLKFLIESFHHLLKIASSDPIKYFSNEGIEVLKNICESSTLNPQSMNNNLLQACIDEKSLTNGYDGRTEVLSSWLLKQDWHLV